MTEDTKFVTAKYLNALGHVDDAISILGWPKGIKYTDSHWIRVPAGTSTKAIAIARILGFKLHANGTQVMQSHDIPGTWLIWVD